MFHQLLAYALLAHAIWAIPIPQQVHALGEIASHIVIVTPQAQVHLESASQAIPFLQHLSPLARFATPAHEETIIYYPASAAAGSLIPLEATSVGRADTGQTKQNVFEQIQQAVQQGASQSPPQLTEAATAAAAAAAAASSAGANLFPALWPAPAGSLDKFEEKRPELTPAATQPFISEARRFYTVPQIIDFVHAPVLVHPVQTIRARSIVNPELAVALTTPPEAAKPEALPLKTIELIEEKLIAEEKKEEEKGRFLEAENLPPKELEKEKPAAASELKLVVQDTKAEIVKPEAPLEPLAPAQLKSDAAVVAADEVPQSKVA